MTNEEAVKIIRSECYIADLLNLDRTQMVNTALDLAIKALEQEPKLDKIRAEIEHVIDNTYDSTDYDKALYNGAYKDGLYEALDIIDKYKAESEDKE